jgi:hypothetical protein
MNTIMASGLGDTVRCVAESGFGFAPHTAQQYVNAFSHVIDISDQNIRGCMKTTLMDQLVVVFDVDIDYIPTFENTMKEYLAGFFTPTTIACNFQVGQVSWYAPLRRICANDPAYASLRCMQRFR